MNHHALLLLLALVLFPLALSGQDTLPESELGEGATWLDTLVSVGSHRLHLRVHRGNSAYTILFEAGGGADLSSWSSVPVDLVRATNHTVVTYDRAGLGSSDLAPPTLSPVEEVRDIQEVIKALEVPTSTVVVGHSYGGMLALTHASEFPAAVVGLVLVDPMNPRFVHDVGDWLKTTVPDVIDPKTDQERTIQRMMATFDELSARLLIEEPQLTVPMVVLTAGEDWWGSQVANAAWKRSHRQMANASENREQLLAARSDHDIPGLQPDLVVSAVERLLSQLGGN